MKQVFNSPPWIVPKEFMEIKKIYQDLGTIRYIKNNTVLKFPGEENRLFYIKKGLCFAYINTNKDTQLIAGVLLPERAIGDMTVISGECVNMTIVAKRDTQVLAVSPDEFRNKITASPGLVMLMAKTVLAKRNSHMEGLITNLTLGLKDRLRIFFLSLAISHGIEIKNELIELPVKLSNEDLAAITASTRVSVSRIMSAWAKEGLIIKNNGRNKLISPGLLKNIKDWHTG